MRPSSVPERSGRPKDASPGRFQVPIENQNSRLVCHSVPSFERPVLVITTQLYLSLSLSLHRVYIDTLPLYIRTDTYLLLSTTSTPLSLSSLSLPTYNTSLQYIPPYYVLHTISMYLMRAASALLLPRYLMLTASLHTYLLLPLTYLRLNFLIDEEEEVISDEMIQ